MQFARDRLAATGIISVIYSIVSAFENEMADELGLDVFKDAIESLPAESDMVDRINLDFTPDQYESTSFYKGKEENGWDKADDAYFAAIVDQITQYTQDSDKTHELITHAKDVFVKVTLRRYNEGPPLDPDSECANCPGCQLILAMTQQA